MADYPDLRELLRTKDNLTLVRNGSKNDDGTDSMEGIDWFKFNGNVVSDIFASGNGWIGFGSNSEQLKVNRRDQALYYLGREEGKVGKSIRYDFLRIYWYGTSAYNASFSDSSYLLEFDVVLIGTGDLYLSITKFPTSASDGSNSLTSEETISFSPGSNRQYTFIHQDALGKRFKITDGLIEPRYAVTRYLYGDNDGNLFTVSDNELTAIKEGLTSDTFLKYGTDIIYSDVIRSIEGLKIYRWQDTDGGRFNITVKAQPHIQTIKAAVDMSDSTITGIKSIKAGFTGNISISYSYDDINYSIEQELDEFLNTDVNRLYEGLNETRKLYLKISLNDNTAALADIVFNFRNEV